MSDLIHRLETYNGTLAGEHAAMYYADLVNKSSDTGGVNGMMMQATGWTGGVFASLWTPDTALDTALTMIPIPYGWIGKILKPFFKPLAPILKVLINTPAGKKLLKEIAVRVLYLSLRFGRIPKQGLIEVGQHSKTIVVNVTQEALERAAKAFAHPDLKWVAGDESLLMILNEYELKRRTASLGRRLYIRFKSWVRRNTDLPKGSIFHHYRYPIHRYQHAALDPENLYFIPAKSKFLHNEIHKAFGGYHMMEWGAEREIQSFMNFFNANPKMSKEVLKAVNEAIRRIEASNFFNLN